jgi:hypothetical protein
MERHEMYAPANIHTCDLVPDFNSTGNYLDGWLPLSYTTAAKKQRCLTIITESWPTPLSILFYTGSVRSRQEVFSVAIPDTIFQQRACTRAATAICADSGRCARS